MSYSCQKKNIFNAGTISSLIYSITMFLLLQVDYAWDPKTLICIWIENLSTKNLIL